MKIILMLAISLFLTACGGGSGGGSSTTPSTPDKIVNTPSEPAEDLPPAYEIEAFSITPSEISPYVNSGNFILSYDVDNEGEQFFAAAYVSHNETLSDSDIKFYSAACNDSLPCGTSPFETDCFYTSDNGLYCGGDDPEDATDITAILDTLPKSANIILEICDSSMLNCKISTQLVTFE